MQISQLRDSLSDYRALLPYAILGVVAGACSAFVIVLFDLLITMLGQIWLGAGSPESFEQLPAWARFSLPVAGALFLGLVFNTLRGEDREFGIVHVLSRMHSHYGDLPVRNALVQFFGGAVALATGASGGREGPGVHLGAAINSYLARVLQLPNNSQRVLIACGTAGSISVAFNTPLAGVIFAMEVIVAEYTVVGFTPVIIAAVTATAIGHGLGITDPILLDTQLRIASLLELPLIALLGVVAGATASLFTVMLKRLLAFGKASIILRFAVAGLCTGALALLVPEIMGMGYDTINDILANKLAPGLLIALVIAKLLATVAGVGLGLPIGLIGPTLMLGAGLGALVGGLGATLYPELASPIAVYALIGMGAGMAAVMNAPLAALLCVLELSGSTGIVFPTMLAIVAAALTHTIIFKQRSAHQTALIHLQRHIPEDPVSNLLHQTNVMSIMDRQIQVLTHELHHSELRRVIEMHGNWFLVQREGDPLFLVRGKALAECLQEYEEGIGEGESGSEDPAEKEEWVDLTGFDLRRWSVAFLPQRATLQEAMDTLRGKTVEAIVISPRGRSDGSTVYGVITRETIEQFYLNRI